MKTTHKTKKKDSIHKKAAHNKTPIHRPHVKSPDASIEVKNWGSSLSERFLSDYAIPFTRLVEAKLVDLQSKV